MYNSILTNMTSLAIQRNLNNSQVGISTSLKRMSTGIKLNQAKDGAADYAITSKMENRISSLSNATNNIAHGQNMLLQMDQALENMYEKVSKIQALALEATNTGYSESERLAIQDEIDQLRKEVYREKEIAAYGDKKIFEPTEIKEVKPYAYEIEYIQSKGNQYIDTGVVGNEKTKVETKIQCIGAQTGANFFGARPVGSGSTNAFVITSFSGSRKIGFFYNGSSIPAIDYDNDIHEYEFGGGVAKIDGIDYGLPDNGEFSTRYNIALLGNANGSSYLTTAQRLYATKIYDGDQLIRDYIPVVDHEGKVALFDKVNQELYYDEKGGDFIAGPVVVPPPPTMSITTLQVGSQDGVDNTITLALNVTFGTLTGSVLNEADSKTLSESAKNYMNRLLESRSQVGSALNRLDSAAKLQSNDIISLNSSKSTIKDTDMAAESTKLAHNQILQQISTSIFTQANQINGNLALRLLAG